MQPVPDQDRWAAWHPADLSRRLDGIGRPWCVVGGWALDLWHGHETREHEDLEFSILREDVGVFQRRLDDLDLYAVRDGTLDRLPLDEAPAADVFQIWCFDRAAASWRADMMVEPGTDAMWTYKRLPEIRRPRAEIVALSPGGVPYLNPAGVLLFKAKHRRPKDEADFETALSNLPPEERRWLKACLDRLHPGHDWARRL